MLKYKVFAYIIPVKVVLKVGMKFAYFFQICYTVMARERGIMKKIYNYTFQLVCIYVLVLSLFSISSFEIEIEHFDSNIRNVNQEKVISSALLAHTDQEDEEEEEALEEESINEIEEETPSIDEQEVQESEETNKKQEESPPTKVEEAVNIVDTSSFTVLAEETVNISHYGHDCYGCTSGYTASGYYIGDGRIYYQDPTFGSVRIVAADAKYPLGTILRLGYQNSTITAIVLDRGGGIGDGKKFQIDLLTTNNSKAYELGIVQNTHLEVLRLGY